MYTRFIESNVVVDFQQFMIFILLIVLRIENGDTSTS